MERIAVMMTDMNYGGVEVVITNYYSYLDTNKYQFDFIAFEKSSVPQREMIEARGGRVFLVPKCTRHPLKYMKAVAELFDENEYSIIHSNMNTLSVFPLLVAKKQKIPVRIVHNHSTVAPGEGKKNLAKYVLRPWSQKYATDYWACSKQAGIWMYGSENVENGKVQIINNAIEIEKFVYDEAIRKQVREELGIGRDKVVIGNVGRLCYQKNQEFLLKVLTELRDDKYNVMIVGDGEKKQELEKMAEELGVSDKVKIIGSSSDFMKYYNAMDIFAMPSRPEGWGMVAVEAQVNGLWVILSTGFPEEIVLTDKVARINLDVSVWVNKVKELTEKCLMANTDDRINADERVFEPYDVRLQAVKLQEKYENAKDKGTKLCD